MSIIYYDVVSRRKQAAFKTSSYPLCVTLCIAGSKELVAHGIGPDNLRTADRVSGYRTRRQIFCGYSRCSIR